MKTLIVFLWALPVVTFAQHHLKQMPGNSYPSSYTPQSVPSGNSTVTNIQKVSTYQVQQSVGKTYDANEINRMAKRDINGIASTVAGVDSRPGTSEIPSIRGAGASGTAYFVDGVRVYGALPIMLK